MPGPRFDSWWGNEDPARYAAQPPGPQKKKKKKNKPFRRENRVKLGNSRMDKWVDIEIYATQTREIFSYKQNFLTQK